MLQCRIISIGFFFIDYESKKNTFHHVKFLWKTGSESKKNVFGYFHVV